jgi:S-DNA-T family DNA segregation ATPase FtsK/SpoIIIE
MARDPYRRQIRRLRRNRSNQFPVLILNRDEPVAIILAAFIAKWVYRHRSALVPFDIALAALITAAIIHAHHAGYWIPVSVITVTLAVIAGFPLPVLRRHPAGRRIAHALSWAWDKCGIPRPIERAYVTAVITVAGGWLAAAIGITPASKPMLLAELTATVILGIPWWCHRRRREKVRVERIIAWWPHVAADIGLPGSKITSAVVDTWGWTARIILKRGATTAHAIARIPEIESGLDLPPGSARIFPDPQRANRCVLRVVETDPHAEPIPWPGQWVTSITKPIDIGLSEDGRPVRVLLLRRNVLIGGIMGAGKSGILNLVIANLAACRDVILWGVDLKGGMELQPWAGCFEKLAVTPQQATDVFRQAVRRLNDRTTRMAAQGKRLWEPTPADPALIIIVDEWAELPDAALKYADTLGRLGRAVALNLVAATQRPTQAAMGKNTAIRSQMDTRLCLRVREPRDTDLILGQGMLSSGWHAHNLTKPGEFLLSDPEHTTPGRNRAYLLTDKRRDQHVTWCAPLRPPPQQPTWPDPPQPGAGTARVQQTTGTPQTAPGSPQTAPQGPDGGEGHSRPETALWDALVDAGPGGVPAAELETACGMSRSWVYYRLQEHAKAGRASQVRRGHWRAVRSPDEPTP